MLPFSECKGALITPRVHPNIAFGGVDTLVCDRPGDNPDVIQKMAVSPKRGREIYTLFQERERTATLAVTKQVCGGLFAGSNPSWTAAEGRAVELLVRAAADYQASQVMMSAPELRASVHQAAAGITSALRPAIDETVGHQIGLMAAVLCDKSTDLEWSYLNHCQKFCNKLLCPELFRTVYPRPSGPRSDAEPPSQCPLPPRYYLHSFAAPSSFPLLRDRGENRGRDHGNDDDTMQEKAAAARLRRSDIGAYMTSLHHTADLISFALGRKLTIPSVRVSRMDIVLARDCGAECEHDEPRLYSAQQLANAVIRMSDHVLEDPFSAMALLSLHLNRSRGVYVDERGRAWAAAAAVEGGVPELRRRWAANRIHVLTAMNVFLAFTRCVSRAATSLAPGRGHGRERLSHTDGRAVCDHTRAMAKDPARFGMLSALDRSGIAEDSESDASDAGEARYRHYLTDTWDMEPLAPPPHTMRRQIASMARLAMSDKGVAWRQCSCAYCCKADEALEEVRRGCEIR